MRALVKPSALAMVRIVLGEKSESKIKAIPLSETQLREELLLWQMM